MQKLSLPTTLKLALRQHMASANLAQDEEMETLMEQLSSLHEKVELVKEKALANRKQKAK